MIQLNVSSGVRGGLRRRIAASDEAARREADDDITARFVAPALGKDLRRKEVFKVGGGGGVSDLKGLV
jgi:hypothetical protein